MVPQLSMLSVNHLSRVSKRCQVKFHSWHKSNATVATGTGLPGSYPRHTLPFGAGSSATIGGVCLHNLGPNETMAMKPKQSWICLGYAQNMAAIANG